MRPANSARLRRTDGRLVIGARSFIRRWAWFLALGKRFAWRVGIFLKSTDDDDIAIFQFGQVRRDFPESLEDALMNYFSVLIGATVEISAHGDWLQDVDVA